MHHRGLFRIRSIQIALLTDFEDITMCQVNAFLMLLHEVALQVDRVTVRQFSHDLAGGDTLFVLFYADFIHNPIVHVPCNSLLHLLIC